MMNYSGQSKTIILLFADCYLSAVDATDRMVVKGSFKIPFKSFELFVLQHVPPLDTAHILRILLNRTCFSLIT